MTLTIHKEEDAQRQLLLTVEVAEERVEKAMRKKAKELARDINFPGFRQGKAPYHVVINRVGRDALRAEVADDLAKAVFEEALAEVDQEEVYGRPEITDAELDPMVFKFTFPLQPVVKLGDYRSLRQDVEPVSVTEDAVAEALEQIRIKHQILEEVDRPIEPGDLVALSGLGKVIVAEAETAVVQDETGSENAVAPEEDKEPEADEAPIVNKEQIIFAEERIDLLMDSSKVYPNTPFVDHLLGLAAGAQANFSFVFPADYEEEELAGKETSFDLTVLNVQSRHLPELNDELAQQEGDYETLEALRAATREKLQQTALAQAKEDLIEGMTDKLLADAELVYPPATIEMELDEMMQTMKNQVRYAGLSWEDYLQFQGLTEDKMRDNFRETAVKRVERGLVIRQLVLEEKLRVNAEDVDAIIAERVQKFSDNEELQNNMRNYYQEGAGFDAISSEVLHEKVYERVKAIYTGTAPDLADLQDEDEESGEEE